MPSRLTDGLPITTEWLNSLVDAINDLTPTSSDAATVRPVTYTGAPLSGTGSLQIEAGEHTGTATAGAGTYESTVSFNTPFKDNDVIVVVTSTFVSQGPRKNRPFKAACAVGLVTNAKFECSVVLTDEDMDFSKGKSVTFNYIAIGKRA